MQLILILIGLLLLRVIPELYCPLCLPGFAPLTRRKDRLHFGVHR